MSVLTHCLTPTPERPLVTFALFSYNQEQFIRQAVESAFAQTYSPLEIILSDDFSSDGTFEIMQEMVAGYSGPHRVVLNQNRSNLGLANHINYLVSLFHGDWVVTAAGDDISLPERSERLVESVMGSGFSCVYSDMMNINALGEDTGVCFGENRPKIPSISDLLITSSCWVRGCSACYSLRLFKEFPAINSKVVQEDHVLPFRALFNGGILYLDDILVKYRSHSTNLWNVEGRLKQSSKLKHWNQNVIELQRKTSIVSQWVVDYESISGCDIHLLEKIRRLSVIANLEFQLATAPSAALALQRIQIGSCGSTEKALGVCSFFYRKFRISPIRFILRTFLNHCFFKSSIDYILTGGKTNSADKL